MTREQAYDIFNRNHATARPLIEKLNAADTSEAEKVRLDQQIHDLALESVKASAGVLSNFEGDVLAFLAEHRGGDITIEMVERVMRDPIKSAFVAIQTAIEHDASIAETLGVEIHEIRLDEDHTIN